VKATVAHVFEDDGSAPNGLDGFPPGTCQFRPDATAGKVGGEDRIMFTCPGCGQWGGVRVGHPKSSPSPSWDIVSGDPADATTLTLAPSIHCVGCCGWHGYLRNGVFESC